METSVCQLPKASSKCELSNGNSLPVTKGNCSKCELLTGNVSLPVTKGNCSKYELSNGNVSLPVTKGIKPVQNVNCQMEISVCQCMKFMFMTDVCS